MNPFEGFSKRSLFWLRLLPYVVFGASVFSLNSTLEINYFFKGYLILIEAQLGIVLIYFSLNRLLKSKSKSSES